MLNRSKSEALFAKAKTLFPGGVNSPVRAFRSVGGTPIFIEKGDGAFIWDADGNKFLDFCASWGPLILGHNPSKVREAIVESVSLGTTFGAPTRKENELAELILNNNRFLDKIRFVSSGTEAVMSAIRLARGFTGRNKILKFEGCYHGHADSLLVKAGSGLVTFGTSSSAGVPKSFVDETLVVGLNDENAVRKAFEDHPNDIACVIIEPVPANNGLLLQRKEFLEFLREICTKNGALLLFDEVINGFRIGIEGAAGYYNIKPDIITYGKIIGGGLPVGAYGGSNELMSCISPEGPVYQAGTLSGNPVAMAAGKAMVEELLQPGFFQGQEERTLYFVEGLRAIASNLNIPMKVFHIASIFWIAFTEHEAIRNADEIDASSMEYFKVMHKELLELGIYLGPSGYEVGFISAVHTKELLDQALVAFEKALRVAFKL